MVKKNVFRYAVVFSVVVALIATLLPIERSEATNKDRIYGSNRFETAVEISKTGWPDGANTVVLAKGDAFPDALAGTPLAYKEDAPILLTMPNKLNAATKKEIQRLKAKKVIILGSTVAVSKTIENELKGMKLTVERIGGANRFDTAAKIAQRVGLKDQAVIASGMDFPDALAVGSYAAREGMPILLTQANKPPKETKNALSNVKKTIVMGGEVAVGKDVYKQLPSPKRINGSNRFGTAAQVVSTLDERSAIESAYVASGMGFADALAGSVLAAKEDKPVLLVLPNRAPQEIKDIVKKKGMKQFTVFGGKVAVQDKVIDELMGKEPEPESPGGDPKKENPAYNENYDSQLEWVNYTRINPAFKRDREWLEERIKNGTASAFDKYDYRFKTEELLWTYYKGPIPASPYEKEAMERVARDLIGVDSWDKASELDKVLRIGDAARAYKFSILESYKFNDQGKLEWIVARPVGMRHAFKVTIDNPYGSVVKNRGWAGQKDDQYDAVYAQMATPELLKKIKDLKVPIMYDYNSNLADDWNKNGMPYSLPDYSKIREREIPRWYAEDYLVKNLYGGDFQIVIGGWAGLQKKTDYEKGSPLIPPEFLDRIPHERGSVPFIETDRY